MIKRILLAAFITSPTFAMSQAGGEDCASATAIPSIPFTGVGSTTGAVDNYFASCPDLANAGGASDVVYSYTTGLTTEYLTFTLCQAGTDYDSQLYIYEGACIGIPYACMEDGCQSPAYTAPYNSALVDVVLNPSTTYYIVIDGYGTAENGNYQLDVFTGNAPPGPEIPFTDATSLLPTNVFHSGVAIGVSDMNNDGLDDIIRNYENDSVFINFQQPNGTFTEEQYTTLNANGAWSMCVGDVDNDGWNDILYAGMGYVRLMRNNGGMGFTEENVPVTSTNPPGYFFAQGSNMADINNDGWNDVFVCNDVGTSKIILNDGAGMIAEDLNYMDLSTTPTSDNSGNYASIWTDYDDDNDLDLYITKCRQGVTDNTDPRRINQLFRNEGNNNWTEVGAQAGVNSGWQGWVSDFGDINNDGLFDLVILNHDNDAELMLNNGDGTFSNITTGSGLEGNVLNFAEIQASFRDFNNDGWVDLLIAGGQHRMFINNGDNTFTEDVNAFVYATHFMESYAIGDLNNDGFLDIYGGYASIYNTPSSREDKLWINDRASGNHYISFDLTGVQSNINGIGAKLKLYGPWGVQVREVRSGEGYGIHNTFRQHFGTGSNEWIDSVYIYWPSGTVDLMRYMPTDSVYHITEGNFNSIPEYSQELNVQVFPNPVSDHVVFSTPNQSFDNAEIRVYDLQGRAIEQIGYHGVSQVEHDISDWSSGAYIFELVTSDGRRHTGRLVKQ